MSSPLPAPAAAFEALYRRYHDQVFATCVRLAGDRVRAAEWTQDVFVRIWEQWARLEEPEDAGAWVHRVTLHTVFNLRRSDQRRLARVALTEDRPPLVAERAGAESRPFGTPAPLRRLALDNAIEGLQGRAREVFILHDVEGHSADEISVLLHLAPSTVRVHLARARERLRLLLSA